MKVDGSFFGTDEFYDEMKQVSNRCHQKGVFEKPDPGQQRQCFKIAVVGQKGAGKSATVLNLCGREVQHKHLETMGIQVIDGCVVAKGVDGRLLTLDLNFWDTGSTAMLQYKHIRDELYKGVDCIMYVCAASDLSSFKFIQRKIDDDEKVPCAKFVVLTKCDQFVQREVCEEDLHELETEAGVTVCKLGNLPLSTIPFYQKKDVLNICQVLSRALPIKQITPKPLVAKALSPKALLSRALGSNALSPKALMSKALSSRTLSLKDLGSKDLS